MVSGQLLSGNSINAHFDLFSGNIKSWINQVPTYHWQANLSASASLAEVGVAGGVDELGGGTTVGVPWPGGKDWFKHC